MNFDLQKFIMYGSKTLNIVNKSLPLVKKISPSLSKIRKIQTNKPSIKKKNENHSSNNITFFR